jgi:hypothetical protein
VRLSFGAVTYDDEISNEPFRLRRVLPVGAQLSDGTWIVSVEIWDDHVTLRWAKPAAPRSSRYIEYADDIAPAEPPFRWDDEARDGVSLGWQLSDDLGTAYSPGGASAGGSERGYRGEIDFDPVPPPTATVLRIGHTALDDVVAVALID